MTDIKKRRQEAREEGTKKESKKNSKYVGKM